MESIAQVFVSYAEHTAARKEASSRTAMEWEHVSGCIVLEMNAIIYVG